MEIYSTTQAREHLFQLVDSTAASHEPIYIVGKRNKAVLLSADDYAAMMETLHLVTLPGMKESILTASSAPEEEFSETIEWEIKHG